MSEGLLEQALDSAHHNHHAAGMSRDASATSARFLAPISADAPSGRDARFEPEHERVRSEIGKINGVRDERTHWSTVESLCSELLETRSKDLLIGAYLACALTVQRGLAGALDGVALLTGLCTRFGNGLFPTRPRARAAAMQWWLEWTSGALDGAQPESLGQVKALRTALRTLDDALRAVLGSDAPIFDTVLRACERLEYTASATPVEAPAAVQALAHEEPAASPFEVAPPATEELARWLAPLAGAAAGEDATYDEPYASVRVEIEKLQGLGNETPNWRLVLDASAQLLETRSKDLTLATYLTAALLELRGVAGLTLGLSLCTGLLDGFWEAMWPPLARIKRRVNGLEWLSDRVAQRLGELSALGSQDLEALVDAGARLQTSIERRFGSAQPNLAPMVEAIARLRKTSAEPAQALAVVEPVVSMPVTAPSVVTAPADTAAVSAVLDDSTLYAFSAPPTVPGELFSYVQRTGALLVELAQSRFAHERSDARAYRWLRQGVWLRWERAPTPNRRGRIDIDGPSPARRADLQKAADAEQWEELLTRSEQQVALHPLWLDPHRLSALALEKLGPEYAVARAHVERESRALFARMPELAELQFSDGSPLAAPETFGWLRPAAQGGVSAEVSLPAPLSERLQRADRTALSELDGLLRSTGSKRASFLLRLDLARALERGQQLRQAVDVYFGLERDLDRYDLEDWEPELAVQVLSPLTVLLAKAESFGVAASEAMRIRARYARIQPAALI